MPEQDRSLTTPWAQEALGRARVLYTDLDGTLFGRGGSVLTDDSGSWSLSAVEAIVTLNSEGLQVFMVSGRNVKQLMEIARLLGWQDFIAEIGCVRVYGRGREIVYDLGDWPEGTLDGRTPYEVIDDLRALEMLQERFPGLIEYHDPYHLDRLATHVLRGEVDIEEAQRLMDTLPLPVKIVDNGLINPMRHTLRDGIERIHAYHLMPKGVSKSDAIAADLAHRGMIRDHALAIGDSPTDLEMMNSVGLMTVVSNAFDSPAMREAVGLLPHVAVTQKRQGHGWAELAHAWAAAKRSLG